MTHPGGEIRLFRPMRRDPRGGPQAGDRANMLGVRPGVDIVADDKGDVAPGRGGVSITPHDPARLPPHVRPAHLGGEGKLPVFVIATTKLGANLGYRPDPRHPDRHGFIEPGAVTPLAKYQQHVAETRVDWEEFT